MAYKESNIEKKKCQNTVWAYQTFSFAKFGWFFGPKHTRPKAGAIMAAGHRF